MIEVYRNSSEYINMSLYQSGQNIAPDGDVTVSIFDHKTDELLATAVAVDEGGRFSYLLPMSLTHEDRTLSVRWDYEIDGEAGYQTDIIEVVTPYVTIDEIYEAYPQLVSRSFEEVSEMERKVRSVINSITGQNFGSRRETVTVYGTNSDMLRLADRCWKVEGLSVNGQTLDLENFNIRHYEDYYAFRPFPFGPYHDIKPDVWYYAGRPYFYRRHRYTVTGLFGWEYVPADINLAAKMLIGDFFCNENAWRQKGITRVRAADWAFDFGPMSFAGTGNLDVDRILSNYRVINMVVI